MLQIVGIVVFSGSFVAASTAVYTSLAPQWQRIMRLATGHMETPFAPLGELARAERHIAVRRWSSTPRPAVMLRAAA